MGVISSLTCGGTHRRSCLVPGSPLLAVFVVTDSMSLLLSAVFRFLTSFGVNFDTLCASSNLSILSRLFDFFWHTTVHSILLQSFIFLKGQ